MISIYQKLGTARLSLPKWHTMVSCCYKSTSLDEDNTKKVSRTQSVPAKSSLFPGFAPVFVSPHIKQIRIACRLKIYQTGFVGLLLPGSMYASQVGYMMPEQVGYVAAFSLFSLLVLGAMGEFFRKFVGIIYLKEDGKQVIISHNTFLGSRRDLLIDTCDIMPISDTPEQASKELIWKIYLYSGKQKDFYICTKFGGIVNHDSFTDIFGEEIQRDN